MMINKFHLIYLILLLFCDVSPLYGNGIDGECVLKESWTRKKSSKVNYQPKSQPIEI